jgi:hypothetical protein
MSEADKIVRSCIDILDRIIQDDMTPKNIKRAADEVKQNLLSGDESLAVRAASSISILEEIVNDPNIPMHARTLIWSVTSQLEQISVDQ